MLICPRLFCLANLFVALAPGLIGATNLKPGRNLPELLEECEIDCTVDEDCAGVLICTASHKDELAGNGWDVSKGWCEKKWRNSPEKLEALGSCGEGVCLYPRILKQKKLGECEADCNHDYDCAENLICADKHTEELAENGWDTRKGYCQKKWKYFKPENLDNLGGPDEGVCLYPRILGQKNLGECEADCDHDYDCEGDLLCADKWEAELKVFDSDSRKAYCNSYLGRDDARSVGDIGGPKEEVCFDPWVVVIGIPE